MLTARELFEFEPTVLQGDEAGTTESTAIFLATRIQDIHMAPLIALPDSEGPPLQQIEQQYGGDATTLRTNKILLLGMAAQKARQAAATHIDSAGVPLIMGTHPTEIVRSFFKEHPSRKETPAQELHMGLSKAHDVFRVLEACGDHNPATHPYLMHKIKSAADKELWHVVYRAHEDANSLNPKVAFLWGGITSWGVQYMRPNINEWLQHFRTQAKYHLLLVTMEQIESGNEAARQALEMVLRSARLLKHSRSLGILATG